jgi:hypothetical protein
MTTKNIITLTTAAMSVCAIAVMAAIILQTFANAQTADLHYKAQYSASGEMILPPDNIWRQWNFVAELLTPNALNHGAANFPEYHNVYIQPWAYAECVKTGNFPSLWGDG